MVEPAPCRGRHLCSACSAFVPTRQSPQRGDTAPRSTAAIGSPARFSRSPLPPGGGARHGGRHRAWGSAACDSRWVRICSASSIHAMICTAPPQAAQISMSMPKTRFRRCAHLIAARRSAGVGSSRSAVGHADRPCPAWPVSPARCWLWGQGTARLGVRACLLPSLKFGLGSTGKSTETVCGQSGSVPAVSETRHCRSASTYG